MKGTECLELLEDVNYEYVASAENAGNRRSAWKIALPVAAGFCLLLGVGLVLGNTLGKKPETGNDITAMVTDQPATEAPVTQAPITGSTAQPTEYAAEIPEEDRLYLTQSDFSSVSIESPESGEIEWGIDYSMFIYNGREYFMFSSLDALSDVIGERLGTIELFDFKYSSHRITTEGSDDHPDDERPYISISENELKGTVEGNFFSVKGYSPDRIVCMRSGYRNMIALFTTDCGITDANGAAFLEEILHISDNLSELRYYSQNKGESRNGTYQYALGNGSSEVSRFIQALDDGIWVNNTRSWGSRYFDEDEAMRLSESAEGASYSVTLVSKDKIDLNFRVYRDGIITVGGYFNSKALSVDVNKIMPLLDLMDRNEGECLKHGEEAKLAECRNDPRFGEMIPGVIPDGLTIADKYIEYVIDETTGEITGTDHIRIDYKDADHDSIIYFWVMPIERKETDPGIQYAVGNGAEIVDIEEFGESSMYIQRGHNLGGDTICAQSVVTYKDAVIYVESVDTQPEVIVALIRSIID